jgi:hypothetical protein
MTATQSTSKQNIDTMQAFFLSNTEHRGEYHTFRREHDAVFKKIGLDTQPIMTVNFVFEGDTFIVEPGHIVGLSYCSELSEVFVEVYFHTYRRTLALWLRADEDRNLYLPIRQANINAGLAEAARKTCKAFSTHWMLAPGLRFADHNDNYAALGRLVQLKQINAWQAEYLQRKAQYFVEQATPQFLDRLKVQGIDYNLDELIELALNYTPEKARAYYVGNGYTNVPSIEQFPATPGNRRANFHMNGWENKAGHGYIIDHDGKIFKQV